jgi:hypothetical protein
MFLKHNGWIQRSFDKEQNTKRKFRFLLRIKILLYEISKGNIVRKSKEVLYEFVFHILVCVLALTHILFYFRLKYMAMKLFFFA